MDKPTLLVIDDEEIMLDSCREIFADNEFRLETAKDGTIGLGILGDINPDIVLVDLKMPGKNGIEVLLDIKKKIRIAWL